MNIVLTKTKKVAKKNKDIDKGELKELKKELILKTIDIDNKISDSKDYVGIVSLKKIQSKLFEAVNEIEFLKNYLEND